MELEAGPQALEEKTVDAIRNNLRLHVSIDGVATVQGFEDAARAALAVVREAMAEPTPEMLGAWYRVKNGHHFHDECPPEDTSDYAAYRAMLSASPLGTPEGGAK